MQSTLVKSQLKVIKPENPINASNSQEFQQQLLAEISAEGVSLVVVNMERVEYVDSAGLMALVSGMDLARSLGKRLMVCNISTAVRMVFEISQLDEAFEILDGNEVVEAAIAPSLGC